MAWEKADFDANYVLSAKLGNDRLFHCRSSRFNGLTDYDPVAGVTIPIHYHPSRNRVYCQSRAQALIDWCATDSSGGALNALDCIVIIGGAFNWLGEALEDLVPGLEALTVDLSQWVQDEKGLSPDAELAQNIIDAGYDPSLPGTVGAYVYALLADPTPRSRNVDKVVQTDLSTQKARNDVRKIFQRNDVTRMVVEDTWDLITPEEQAQYLAAAASYGAEVIEITNGVISQL